MLLCKITKFVSKTSAFTVRFEALYRFAAQTCVRGSCSLLWASMGSPVSYFHDTVTLSPIDTDNTSC